MGRKQVASIRASSRLRKTTAIHLLVSTLALWIVWQVLPQTSVAQTFSYIHPLALNSNTLAPFKAAGWDISKVRPATIDAGTLQTFNATFSGFTPVTNGGATLTLAGSNTYTPTTTFAPGTLFFKNPGKTLPGGTVSFKASTVSFKASGNVFTFGGLSGSSVLGGTGSLTKFGAGTLTLSGANTYTGSTTVSAGTLVLAKQGTNNTLLTGLSSGLILSGEITDNDMVKLSDSSGSTLTVSELVDVVFTNSNNVFFDHYQGEILPQSGVVLVPEPATAALLASGGLLLGGFALWRRRRVPLLACKQ